MKNSCLTQRGRLKVSRMRGGHYKQVEYYVSEAIKQAQRQNAGDSQNFEFLNLYHLCQEN